MMSEGGESPGLERRQGPVTWRSVGIGLISAILIAVLTPYNNYVLNNTDLVGTYLPTSVLLIIGFLVLAVNPLVMRLWPDRHLTRGELAVSLAMMLVACALPAGGLMRYLPGNLAGIYYNAAAVPDYQRLLEAMDLPEWVFPSFETDTIQSQGNEPVIQGYLGRIASEGGIAGQFAAVPWGAWLKPALTWALFIGALYGSILSLVFIFRRQWMENERLQFPIATVLSSLIEPPEKGRYFNALFRSKLFWWAFAIVFVLHAFNALYTYNPKWPAVPLKFNIAGILSQPPAFYVDNWAKTQTIYFSVIGIACLIESKLSLSLWVFFLLVQVTHMSYGSYQASFSDAMQHDQFFGGILVYAIVAIWVARTHLGVVLLQMLRGSRPDEPHGRYLPYAFAGWLYVACMIVQVAWLMAVGCTLVGAVVLTLLMGTIFFALIRMVAETGLLYVTFTMELNLPWQYTTQLPETIATRTNLTTNFMSSLFTGMLVHDVRQAFGVYASHATAVADKAYERNVRARPAIPLVLSLVLAVTAAYVLSGASMLWVEYSYAATLDQAGASPLNSWGARDQPRWWTLERAVRYIPPENGPSYPHSRWGHFGFGAALTAVLSYARLSYVAFPLHPLGYILALTLGVRWVWFSILLGWLLKASIMKLGGATLFRELKPLAMGLILGETVAAAFWLVVSFVWAMMGWEYKMIQITLT